MLDKWVHINSILPIQVDTRDSLKFNVSCTNKAMQTLVFTKFVLHCMGFYGKDSSHTVSRTILGVAIVTLSIVVITSGAYVHFLMKTYHGADLWVQVIYTTVYIAVLFKAIAYFLIQRLQRDSIYDALRDIQIIVDGRKCCFKRGSAINVSGRFYFLGIKDDTDYIVGYSSVEDQYHPVCRKLFLYFLSVLPMLAAVYSCIPLYNHYVGGDIAFVIIQFR